MSGVQGGGRFAARNIVNRTSLGMGARLELTADLRKAMFEENHDTIADRKHHTTPVFWSFVAAVREGIAACESTQRILRAQHVSPKGLTPLPADPDNGGMRRLHLWLACSAALAGAAMVLVLAVSDLERMSWVASAGSFVIGVCALVLAYAMTKVPTGRSGLATVADDGHGPVVVHRTTAGSRIRMRVTRAVSGLLYAIGYAALILVIGRFVHGKPPEIVWAEALAAPVASLGLLALTLILIAMHVVEAPPTGQDMLVVNENGMTVVDRRWLRRADQSWSARWDELESVRVRPDDRSDAYQRIVVRFNESERAEKLSRKHCLAKTDDGLAIFALLTRDVTVLATVRAALVRFGGRKCQR